MSWLKSLYETYRNLEASGETELMPIAHSTQNAHVEITINTCGEFVRADFVSKDDSETLIPVTESSASRSGKSVFPHALCDKLQYLAKDLNSYAEAKELDFYGEYMKQLKAWHESKYTTPKIDAVYAYLDKGTIIKDLIGEGIFSTDSGGRLTEKWENTNVKMSAGDQQSAFIRFRVSGDGPITAVWQDKTIAKRWIEFYLHSKTDTDICYVTGSDTLCATRFPKRIRHSADGAKLISSNDTTNFTYRGRFKDAAEAVNIGFEVSQKAHNALKYLINKQGERIGDRVFILWGTQNEATPPLIANTDALCEEDDTSDKAVTKDDCAKRFARAISGYKADIDFKTKLALIGLDSATPGRMAIVSYSEYCGVQAVDLIDKIKEWHTIGAWEHEYNDGEARKIYYGVPSPFSIATAAYGVNQNGMLKISNNKLTASIVTRLLSCVTGGNKVPRDIVNMLLLKSSQPQNYENYFQWKKILATACTMYAKYLHDYEGEDVDMNIDENSKSMDYILGRMLALLHTIELRALRDKNEGGLKNRSTNAMRYFTRLAHDPFHTYNVIYEKVLPYRQQLGIRGNKLYKLLGELSAKIDPEEFVKKRNLDGRFILGFESQLQNPPCKSSDGNQIITEEN